MPGGFFTNSFFNSDSVIFMSLAAFSIIVGSSLKKAIVLADTAAYF